MKQKVYLPSHIANYFLLKAQKEDILNMTPMKLMKLVYFSYAWNLAIFDRKLFAERIEAWKYGPVVPSIYHEFKEFGNSPITKFSVDSSLETGELSYNIIEDNDGDTLRVVATIWKIYKYHDGWSLSKITHEDGSPWSFAYAQGENTIMDDKEIVKRANLAISKYRNHKND